MPDPQRIVDDVMAEVRRAIRGAQHDIRREWAWAKEDWAKHRSKGCGPGGGWPADLADARQKLREVPDQISDLASSGGSAVRYVLGYFLKGIAACQAFGGLMVAAIAVATKAEPWRQDEFTIGIVLIATAQLIWWAGRLLVRSGDRKRYARDQNRLLRLAWKRNGSLTVLEAATDLRLTVEKAEEMLRELSARGHAEVRVSESGLIVYHFLEISRTSEKFGARPVDEL